MLVQLVVPQWRDGSLQARYPNDRTIPKATLPRN